MESPVTTKIIKLKKKYGIDLDAKREVIGLEEESVVLLLHLLDSEEKIFKFNEWVKTKLNGDKIQATETEVCGAASLISKNIPVN